ncbi:hypothetical protein AB0O34_18595 [Sphaerisporangium sp. NPDC088356]|uniref:hypothetical protein n=1 Tax=Sphaerisporangium sp. NPDC088356 TaxID=3154871 RepID=UPI003442A4DD
MDDAPRLPSFLGRRLPPAFALRTVVVSPGRARVYDEAEWRDAIVAVERGRIELLCSNGHRHVFEHGEVLWLHGLPVHVLYNPVTEPAVLIAVSRRGATSES